MFFFNNCVEYNTIT